MKTTTQFHSKRSPFWPCLLLLTGLFFNTGKGQSSETAPEGMDLKLVPRNVVGFIALRPAAIFQEPGFGEVARAFSRLAPEGFPALPVEKIAQVTFVLPGRKGEPPHPLGLGRTVICTMIEPYDFESLLQKEMPQAEQRVILGTIYYADQRRKNRFILFPDERTLVMAEREKDLQEVLSRSGENLPMFLEAESWKPFQDNHIVVAVDGAPVEAFASWPGMPGLARVPLDPFGVVWGKNPTVLGIHLDDRTKLHATTIVGTDAGTAEIQKKYQSVIEGALVLSKGLRGSLQGSGETEQGVLSKLLDDYERLLTNASIQVKGRTVHIETFADTEAVKRYLGALVQEFQASARDAERITTSQGG